MNKTILKCVFTGLLALFVNAANAELFVNPIQKNSQGGTTGSLYVGSSEVEYEANGATGDVDRTFIGGTFTYGNSSSLDFFGTIAYTLEAELESVPDDDTGFILGGGFRMIIPNSSGLNLHGYGQLLFIDEEYGFSIEGEETSMMVGVAASKKMDQNFVGYVGVELNIYSDMEINNGDADRDDFLGFRVGGNYDAGTFLMNFNLSLMHETGIFFSVSQPL